MPICWIKINFFLLLAILIGFQKTWATEAQEYELKATYIYNFAKFIDWPPEKLKGSPIVLCVMGHDSLKNSLEKLSNGKLVKERPLQVKNLTTINEVKSCHVVFISEAESKKLSDILKKISLEKILSVGDSSHFIDNGGQVQFFVEEQKLRFEINLASVDQAGLKIDARVLNIAKIRR